MASLCVLAALAACFLQPARAESAEPGPKAGVIEWAGYEQGVTAAGKAGRFTVVDFYTTWCRDCKRMDKETFSDPAVIRTVSEGFVAVKVDGEQRPELTSAYGVFAYPTIWILAPDGSKACQRIGYMSPGEFAAFLDYAYSGAYKSYSFGEHMRNRTSGGDR